MIRVLLFVAFALSSSLAVPEECKMLAHPQVLRCCKRASPSAVDPDDIKECMAKFKPPPNCEGDICHAKKMGYTGPEDGTFDKKNLEQIINKKFESMPEMAESIVKDCINGDLSSYGPSDFCDLMKFRHCLQGHLFLACPEWSTEGECAATKELIDKCAKE